MDTSGTRVKLKLHTTIDDGGQLERNTVEETGILYQRQHMDVLTYEEKLDDGPVINNLMTIQSNKVSIKRTGPIAMHQQFDLDRMTENVYQHPHGNLHMETTTTSVDYWPLDIHSNGLLKLYYTVKLNGQAERKHTLILSLTEEASR